MYKHVQVVFLVLVVANCLEAQYIAYPYPAAQYIVVPQPVQDTPEVAQARAAHFATFNAIAAANNRAPGAVPYAAAQRFAAPPVLVNGVPADTPEVAAAKAAHFAAHAAARGHLYG